MKEKDGEKEERESVRNFGRKKTRVLRWMISLHPTVLQKVRLRLPLQGLMAYYTVGAKVLSVKLVSAAHTLCC